MPTKPLPFELIIPEPCGEDWQAMGTGGPARRHCERCQTDVVDVSLLTGAELNRLVERTGGDFCARVTRLPDGTMLLRQPPQQSVLLPASRFRGPLLATAVLAGSAGPLLAQGNASSGAHAAVPALSCAEVTALKQGGGLPAEAKIVAPAPAAAPAPPPGDRQPEATMGKPAIPLVALHGTVRLPRGRRVHNGLVDAYNQQGFSKSMPVQPDGSFSGALPRGKYWLRAEVRADDAELYATVDGITVGGEAVTHDLNVQGPVTVTAGAPVAVPSSGQSQRR